MNQHTSEDLDKIISELDILLFDGYGKENTIGSRFRLSSSQKDFNLNEFIHTIKQEESTWFVKVVEILSVSLKERHYLFHFLKQKRTAMSVIGVPNEISNIMLSFEYYLLALEEVLLRLIEIKNLAVRQEIAQLENRADILYKITFSSHTREVKLNNIILAKPDFDSENDNFFQFMFINPGRPINIEELSTCLGGRPTKRLAHIVRDLGFVGDIKSVFFPVVTKNIVMFVNPVTKQYAYKHDLPAINFKKIVRQSETK